MTFTAQQDRKLIRRTGGSKRYVLAHVEAPTSARNVKRPPVNIALVIDRSGSMQGPKLQRAIDAACYTIERLSEQDRFAVIAYDDDIDVVVASTAATPAARRDAIGVIRRIRTGGSTNLCEGWLRGCQQVAEVLREEAIGRCFLLTDGLANCGVVDHNEIIEHAGNLRKRHIVTSTFGIGEDFDEDLLARMASAGGGNFYFIATADDIPKFIDQQTGESLDIVARDVVIAVDADPRCQLESLNDFPVERTASGWQVLVGSLTSGQDIEPLISVAFPAGESGDQQVRLTLSSRDGLLAAGPVTLAFKYASDSENTTQPRARQVDRPVARIYAARAQRQASLRNRERDFDGARRAIQRCLDRIMTYAGDDPEILDIVAELESARRRYSRDMDPMLRKASYSASSMSVKDRTSVGSARRKSRGEGIVLLPTTADLIPLCRAAARALNGHWGGTVSRIDVLEAMVGQAAQAGLVGSLDEIKLATRARRDCVDYAVRMVITDRQFADNWFSHWFAEQQTAIVTLHGWSEVCKVSPVAYVGQEILLHGLNALSSRFDLMELAHQDTRGCLFDFCSDKPDLEVKLQTMDVCPSCRRKLGSMRIDTALVLGLCTVIRDIATGRMAA